MYAILAFGVYITYSILDFPDLSVDGTVPLGAVVTGILIVQGVNPWLCCLIAFICGGLAGCVTGILHVKLHIRPLLCGILVMTALLSVNLVLMMAGTGGLSIVSFFDKPTIFSDVPASFIPEKIGDFLIRAVIVSGIVAIVLKYALDWYMKTKSGLLLRAAGNNEQYAGTRPGRFKNHRAGARKRICRAGRFHHRPTKGVRRPADGHRHGRDRAGFGHHRAQFIQTRKIHARYIQSAYRRYSLQSLPFHRVGFGTADSIPETAYGDTVYNCPCRKRCVQREEKKPCLNLKIS